MKKFFEEFKAFALRGNVMDLAIGVLIGAAFTALVTAFTEDIIQPILNLFGGANANLGWVIPIGSQNILIGKFISAIVNFIIYALIIFIIMKSINKLMSIGSKKDEVVTAPTTKKCPYCCTEIAIEAKKCPNCTSDLEA